MDRLVTITARRLEQLELAAKERDDYIKAVRMMRHEAPQDHTPWAKGWRDCMAHWSSILLDVMAARN